MVTRRRDVDCVKLDVQGKEPKRLRLQSWAYANQQCLNADSEIDWISGVGFGDDLSIAVEPGRIGTTSFDVHYTVLRDDVATCTAKIVYVSISSDGAGKQPVPALLRKALT